MKVSASLATLATVVMMAFLLVDVTCLPTIADARTITGKDPEHSRFVYDSSRATTTFSKQFSGGLAVSTQVLADEATEGGPIEDQLPNPKSGGTAETFFYFMGSYHELSSIYVLLGLTVAFLVLSIATVWAYHKCIKFCKRGGPQNMNGDERLPSMKDAMAQQREERTGLHQQEIHHRHSMKSNVIRFYEKVANHGLPFSKPAPVGSQLAVAYKSTARSAEPLLTV